MKIFISCDQTILRDKEICEELSTRLSSKWFVGKLNPIKLTVWHEGMATGFLEKEIEHNIAISNIAILIISPRFLGTKNSEIIKLETRSTKDRLILVPVLSESIESWGVAENDAAAAISIDKLSYFPSDRTISIEDQWSSENRSKTFKHIMSDLKKFIKEEHELYYKRSQYRSRLDLESADYPIDNEAFEKHRKALELKIDEVDDIENTFQEEYLSLKEKYNEALKSIDFNELSYRESKEKIGLVRDEFQLKRDGKIASREEEAILSQKAAEHEKSFKEYAHLYKQSLQEIDSLLDGVEPVGNRLERLRKERERLRLCEEEVREKERHLQKEREQQLYVQGRRDFLKEYSEKIPQEYPDFRHTFRRLRNKHGLNRQEWNDDLKSEVDRIVKQHKSYLKEYEEALNDVKDQINSSRLSIFEIDERLDQELSNLRLVRNDIIQECEKGVRELQRQGNGRKSEYEVELRRLNEKSSRTKLTAETSSDLKQLAKNLKLHDRDVKDCETRVNRPLQASLQPLLRNNLDRLNNSRTRKRLSIFGVISIGLLVLLFAVRAFRKEEAPTVAPSEEMPPISDESLIIDRESAITIVENWYKVKSVVYNINRINELDINDPIKYLEESKVVTGRFLETAEKYVRGVRAEEHNFPLYSFNIEHSTDTNFRICPPHQTNSSVYRGHSGKAEIHLDVRQNDDNSSSWAFGLLYDNFSQAWKIEYAERGANTNKILTEFRRNFWGIENKDDPIDCPSNQA